MSTHNIYLLDTCICIALLKKKQNVVQRLRKVGINNCKISDITLAELYFGAIKGVTIDKFVADSSLDDLVKELRTEIDATKGSAFELKQNPGY